MTETAEVDKESLRRLLLGLREYPPKIRTPIRRELRGVGDGVIAEQKRILAGPLPQGVAVTGRQIRLRTNKKTGKKGFRLLNVYGDADVKQPGRGSGMRDGIAAGLKTRVVTGPTRQGIDIRTTGPKDDGGYNKARFWQSQRFRHPVFGRDVYVYQAGQPYFFEPVRAGRDEMLRRTEDILERAARQM